MLENKSDTSRGTPCKTSDEQVVIINVALNSSVNTDLYLSGQIAPGSKLIWREEKLSSHGDNGGQLGSPIL